MAVTLTTAARDAACDAVVDLIEGGTGDANGDLVIRNSGNTPVATLAFSNPAFGASSNGTATAATISDDTNAAGGTADNFIFQNLSNAEVLSGTVTVTSGGGDLELSSVTIGAGDTVSVTSFTVTMPAS